METANPTVSGKDMVRVKRETLEKLLDQCHIAIQQLASGCDGDDQDEDGEYDDVPQDSTETSSAPSNCDTDAPEFYDLLKSRVGCADFLKKLENAQSTIALDEASSWDIVNENDFWEGGRAGLDTEDYVLVCQDDIMDGIAAFMAAYLSSLERTKDLTPNQLQEVLSKAFSMKKKKGKLKKAWDGSKVIYNVVSWGATAIGIYQNPALLRAATAAFWTSCHAISKLL